MLMNVAYYLEFLNTKLDIKAESILERNLTTWLGSVEAIAMLRVLAILQVAVTVPIQWLAEKTKDLAKYDWGVADMGLCVDLMKVAFLEVSEDGEMMLDEDFMMNIFKPIANKVKPFEDYLTMMFEEKTSYPICSFNKNDKGLSYDLLKLQLFYPTRVDIRGSHELTCHLGEVTSSRFVVEFRDPSKGTSSYLSSIDGKKYEKGISSRVRSNNDMWCK